MKICLAVVLACLAPTAGAEMWKCVDGDGNTRYTNVRAEIKGCKALNLEPLNTAQEPRAQQQPKPANFPSVDSDTQKQRDAGRRKILEQEMAQEQQQLDAAKKATGGAAGSAAGQRKELCAGRRASQTVREPRQAAREQHRKSQTGIGQHQIAVLHGRLTRPAAAAGWLASCSTNHIVRSNNGHPGTHRT
jgi:Domain of unknown function (DUF4124)